MIEQTQHNRFQKYLSLLRHRLDFLLINLTLLLLLIGIVIFLLWREQPISEPIPQTQLPSQETIKENFSLDYYGEKVTPFSELPYYIAQDITPPDIIINQIINRFDLQPTKYSKDIYYSPDEKVRLSLTPDHLFAELNFNNELSSESTVLPSLEQAENTALQMLQNLGFSTDSLQVSNDEIRYFAITGESGEYVEVSQPERAEMLQLPFRRTIQDVPLLISSQALGAIQVNITSQGISSIQFNPILFSTEKKDTLQTISIDEALAQIRQGNYSLSTAILRGSMEGSRAVDTMTLRDFTVVYRLNLENQQILPYYDFSGEVQLKDKSVSPILLTTPAVRVDLIQQNQQSDIPENIRE